MYHTLIGVDEAGRGPLAGPVAVGVVAIPHDFELLKEIPGINDSKLLSEKKRDAVYARTQDFVRDGTVRYVVNFASADIIDSQGIVRAIRTCVKNGVQFLAPAYDGVCVLLDGLLVAPREYAQETIIHGDAIQPIIGLASIMAKVERDRLMADLHSQYPNYGFADHKGYGTKAHMDAIRVHGLSDIHRRSYCSAFI